ncbi:translation elongation factor Ts [Pelagibacteraceae bacterium]|nr:translation elongation factor Ts [Pelagibacteraceae bacterium]
MSNKELLENIKKLREITGVGFKDCKLAIDESGGDIDKSIEFLRKKGIAKATKKMSRTAAEGLALVEEKDNEISIIEINSETDFVAKNKDFISFCKEISEICFSQKGDLDKINNIKMKNNISVKDNLIDLIAKIGEKITLRRAKFFDKNDGKNFFYVHSSIEKKIGKIISIVKIKDLPEDNFESGNKLAMHIAASNPLAIDKQDLDKKVIDKELEIIKAELVNSGKKDEMIDKISQGKLNKFISDNTLLNQVWIMDPKMKVSNILKNSKVLDFIRFKVGEGV